MKAFFTALPSLGLFNIYPACSAADRQTDATFNRLIYQNTLIERELSSPILINATTLLIEACAIEYPILSLSKILTLLRYDENKIEVLTDTPLASSFNTLEV